MKTLNIKKALSALLVMLMLTFAVAVPAFAAEGDDAQSAATVSAEAAEAEAEGMTTSGKAYACAIAVGIAAAGGAVAMQVLREHRPPARGRGQDPHLDDADPGLYRDRHHLCPAGGHPDHLCPVSREVSP